MLAFFTSQGSEIALLFGGEPLPLVAISANASRLFSCSLNIFFFQTDSSWGVGKAKRFCFVRYERRFLVKPTLRCLFLPIVRRFAMLIASMALIAVGSMTSSGALAAPPFQKSGPVNANVSPDSIQRTSRTLYTSNGVAEVASLPPTKVVQFSPSGIRGTLDAPADCWMTSTSAPRANAWRCGVKHIIHDPCFSTSPQANSVICDADPTGDTRGLKATLAHPLPAGTSSSGIQAWVMSLSDGSVCTFANGATGLFGGERLNYNCTSGWWIVGSPRIGSVWMVRLVKWGQSPQTQPVMMSVLEVWW